jgi:S1-C subfamily serine protease
VSKTIECIYCRRHLQATKSAHGHKIVCPYCRKSFVAGVEHNSPPPLPPPAISPAIVPSRGISPRRIAGLVGFFLGIAGATLWFGLFAFAITWVVSQRGLPKKSVHTPMAEILKSVVKVEGSNSLGTGFLIEDGTAVVTNFHVIAGQDNISVKFSDDTVVDTDGFLIASPEYDLAILHLPKKGSAARALPLAKGRPVAGDKVIAVGNPIGLEGTITEGIVSACRTWPEMVRSLGVEDPQRKVKYAADSSWIQTSAPISQGNSGGPLLNEKSEVIGVNTWQFSPEAAQNLNFAIDISHVNKLVSTLPSMKVRAYASLPEPEKHASKGSDPRIEAIRQRNIAYWEWQAEVVGRWYALSSVAMVDLWGEPREGETQQRRRLRILDELRGCARRSLQDVEQLGRAPTDSVEPELRDYLEQVKSLLTDISAAYSESTKTYLQIAGTRTDVTRGAWFQALLEPQQELNDIINTNGEAVRTRLSFLFKVRFCSPIAFTPGECIKLCVRKTEVPAEPFSAIFTGSPDRFLFPTYFRHEEAGEAIEILNFIKEHCPKDSEAYVLAEKFLAERHGKQPAEEKPTE